MRRGVRTQRCAQRLALVGQQLNCCLLRRVYVHRARRCVALLLTLPLQLCVVLGDLRAPPSAAPPSQGCAEHEARRAARRHALVIAVSLPTEQGSDHDRRELGPSFERRLHLPRLQP
eukprot:1487291-Prymnesium_polylepis.2